MKKILYFSLLIFLFSCNKKQEVKAPEVPLVDAAAFADTIEGKPVALYTLESGKGLIMQVTNYGGRVVTLWAPDKDGVKADVVVGHKTLKEYTDPAGERFLGCVVGRYANRIAKGQFTLDGKKYQVPLNNNGQSLHGGFKGFDTQVWTVNKVTANEIQMSYVSPDGEEGYPGTLTVKMTYTLTPDNEFKLTYEATTDKPTVVNLSHHGFFNLKGEGNGTILDHKLMINSEQITPVNDVLIPTGKLMSVEGTPFDFRNATLIGERIEADHPQLKAGLGYDHNWILKRNTNNGIELAASVYEPASGRLMEVWTDQPGIQFYSGNFFNGKGIDTNGKTIDHRSALALETQKFPDSPNQSNFISTRLNPRETYRQTCIYKFSVK